MSRDSIGSKCTSDAPSSTACAISELTSLMTGASSADSRISVRAASSSSSSSSSIASATASSRRLIRAITAGEVVRRRDHARDRVAGHQLEVVEREHVRRVDHRDEQPLAGIVEADRSGVVALGRLRAHEVERARVGLVDRQVDEVEAEALGDRAGELLGRQVAGVDEDLLRRPPGGLRLLHCGLHALGGDEAELGDHIGDEAGSRRRASSAGSGRCAPRRDASWATPHWRRRAGTGRGASSSLIGAGP